MVKKKGHAKIILLTVLFTILGIILIGVGYYFFVVNNILAQKADIVKPELNLKLLEENPNLQIIKNEHVEYLGNEVGSYKLKPSDGEEAVIIFEMADINKEVALIKGDQDSYATEEIPENVDLIVRGDQIELGNIILSENVVSAMKDSLEEGNLEIEVVSDQETLLDKGFLPIYQELT